MNKKPKVGIIMGSDSDLAVMAEAGKVFEEFGVKYNARHIRRILEEMGFSVQRPKRILAKADPMKQNRWRRYTYPNLKKKRAEKDRGLSLKTRPVSVRTQPFTERGHDGDKRRKFQ